MSLKYWLNIKRHCGVTETIFCRQGSFLKPDRSIIIIFAKKLSDEKGIHGLLNFSSIGPNCIFPADIYNTQW
jgi:hypothetical protein